MRTLGKAGGLGDVVDALARGLGRTGALDGPVDVFLPAYRSVALPAGIPVEELRVAVPGPYGPPTQAHPQGVGVVIVRSVLTHGYRLRLVDFPAAFDRDAIYGHPDDAWRFGLLGRAALETLRAEARPVDLLHVHDWHASTTLVLRDRFYAADPIVGRGRLASILTIHNLAYHGWVEGTDLATLGLVPGDSVVARGAAGIDLLWAGIERADLVNTVSPTFAAQALTSEFGFGLDQALRWKAAQRDMAGRPRFFGILNGIDPAVWDPATDPDLAAPYSLLDPAGKVTCIARARRTRQTRLMLLGRKDERLALDRLFAQARDGRSGVLALVGEPGIGKSALLEHAVESAGEMRMLRCRGIGQAVIPFAGLAELLRPALGALGRIPEPQAAALAGALALGPAGARDRFASGAAALSLLSASAEEGRSALLVDDAHWLDRSSAETLLFAARRLLADPIALVLTVREGQPSLLDGADLRTLRMAGLHRSDAAELLSREEMPDDAIERLYRATGGNPLALLELAPEAARLATLPGVAPVPISTSIATAFLRRFGRMPETTRRVLVLLAASDGCALAVLARAASSLGLDIGDLAPAEEVGLVTVAPGEIQFTHPLARAVYSDAAAPERREAHAALAAALPDRDVDQRAWHLAAASVGPDDQASRALEQAGARARERSAYAVAAAAFERAAGLASIDDARDRLLFAAAEAAWLAGDGQRTLALLDEAQTQSAAPAIAARIDYLRGQVAMRCGPVMDGYPLIVGAAAQIAEDDPELAVVMLAQAVHGCFYTGDTPAMIAAAERAVALASGQDSRRATFFAAMAQGMAWWRTARARPAPPRRRAVTILEESDELRDDRRLLVWAALGPLWLREAKAGRGLIDRAFERARAQAALGALPYLLHLLARDQATTDQWAAAETSYDEAIRLGRETGQRVEVAAALAGLACLEARQGREDACREHAAEATSMCEELGVGLYGVWAIQALGDLELGLGRPAAAIEHHLAQADALREGGIADVDLSPAPELVEAFLRVGREKEATAAAADFDARATAKGQPWALARAARCRGLLADPGELESCFDEALDLHERTPDAFETARTRLAYGARLRRARKRIRAREELRAALAIFEQLGSEPWADQTRAELAASGETARRRDVSTLDELTPQELQIARLLADGRTTREAAAAIFVSPKTVEYHLGHVYQKLGIHSREELAAAFPAPQEP